MLFLDPELPETEISLTCMSHETGTQEVIGKFSWLVFNGKMCVSVFSSLHGLVRYFVDFFKVLQTCLTGLS